MGYERRCRHCTCGKQSQFSQGIGGQGSGVSDLTLGPLCETNPIAPDPNEGQVPCGKEVMSSQAPNGIGKTKPICDRPSLRKEDAHGYVVSDSTGPATRCRQQEGPSDGIQGVVVLPTAWRGHLALESRAGCLRHTRAGRPRHDLNGVCQISCSAGTTKGLR